MNDNFKLRSGLGIIDNAEEKEELSESEQLKNLFKLRREIEEEILIISDSFDK